MIVFAITINSQSLEEFRCSLEINKFLQSIQESSTSSSFTYSGSAAAHFWNSTPSFIAAISCCTSSDCHSTLDRESEIELWKFIFNSTHIFVSWINSSSHKTVNDHVIFFLSEWKKREHVQQGSRIWISSLSTLPHHITTFNLNASAARLWWIEITFRPSCETFWTCTFTRFKSFSFSLSKMQIGGCCWLWWAMSAISCKILASLWGKIQFITILISLEFLGSFSSYDFERSNNEEGKKGKVKQRLIYKWVEKTASYRCGIKKYFI